LPPDNFAGSCWISGKQLLHALPPGFSVNETFSGGWSYDSLDFILLNISGYVEKIFFWWSGWKSM
jgi:hypothetical protein